MNSNANTIMRLQIYWGDKQDDDPAGSPDEGWRWRIVHDVSKPDGPWFITGFWDHPLPDWPNSEQFADAVIQLARENGIDLQNHRSQIMTAQTHAYWCRPNK